LNVGVKGGHPEWNVMLMEGSSVGKGFIQRLFRPVKSNKDIVFPCVVDYDRQGRPVDMRGNFYNGTLNGLTIHRGTFEAVGDMGDNDLEVEKLLWEIEAREKGCQFKAVLGAKAI
jgi:hypothetical protein